MSKKKLTGIIIGCTAAIVIAALVIITDPFTPFLSVNPLNVSFTVPDGLDPLPQILEIGSTRRAVSWFAIDDARWLDIEPTEGSTDKNTSVTLSVDLRKIICPDEYAATVTVYASEAKNGLVGIRVKLVVTETKETRAIKEAVHGSTDSVQISYVAQPPYAGISLINNQSATDPTWRQLIRFVKSDDTDKQTYIEDVYMCGDFAENLHNNAEREGIRAAWVAVDFSDGGASHALNAFHTRDVGLVFVDCTGSGFEVIVPRAKDAYGSCASHDKIAYVRIGAEYGLVSLDSAGALSYDFYERYLQDWQDYERRVEVYNKRVEQYKSLVRGRTVIDNMSEYLRLKAIYDELEEERAYLESLRGILGDCRWKPLGVVSKVQLYW